MALQTNSYQEPERKYALVVGIATMRPWVVNPTLSQLQQMGVPSSQEPSYLFEYQGERKRIISIWFYGENNVLQPDGSVKVEKLLGELQLYLKMQKGDTYIDKTGKYAKDRHKLHDAASARLAYPQEWKLTDLLRCYGRVGYTAECSLDSIDALIQEGDVRELQAAFDLCGKQVDSQTQQPLAVRVALGVKDGQYQVVSSRAFAMDNQLSMRGMYEELAKGVEFEKKCFYGDFLPNSSAAAVQTAVRLHVYQEEEALAQDDRLRQLQNTSTMSQPGMRPAAPAPPAPAGPNPYGAPAPAAAQGSAAPAPAAPAPPAAPAAPPLAAPAPARNPTQAAPVGSYSPPGPATEPRVQAPAVPVAVGEDENDLPF